MAGRLADHFDPPSIDGDSTNDETIAECIQSRMCSGQCNGSNGGRTGLPPASALPGATFSDQNLLSGLERSICGGQTTWPLPTMIQSQEIRRKPVRWWYVLVDVVEHEKSVVVPLIMLVSYTYICTRSHTPARSLFPEVP